MAARNNCVASFCRTLRPFRRVLSLIQSSMAPSAPKLIGRHQGQLDVTILRDRRKSSVAITIAATMKMPPIVGVDCLAA